MREQGGIRRNHDDDRAGFLLPNGSFGELRPTGTPATINWVAQPVIRLNEHAHGVSPAALNHLPRRRADPSLELVADHARAAADVPFLHGPRPGTGQGREDVLRLHVKAVDVIQVTVPRLGDDRQRPQTCGGPDSSLFDLVGDHGIAHHADAVRVRDHDRPFQFARLLEPVRAGHARRCR